MRTTKEVLKIVREELVNVSELGHYQTLRENEGYLHGNHKVYVGICHTVKALTDLSLITRRESSAVLKLIDAKSKQRFAHSKLDKPFFFSDGVRTLQRDQFLWTPRALKPRLNWIDKELKKQ